MTRPDKGSATRSLRPFGNHRRPLTRLLGTAGVLACEFWRRLATRPDSPETPT